MHCNKRHGSVRLNSTFAFFTTTMSAPTEKVSYEAQKAHTDHIDDHNAMAHGSTPNTGSNGVTTPDIDYEKAASFKPSKLHGKGLGFMVTFVAGTGVSRRPRRSTDRPSLPSSATTKVSCLVS